MAEQYENEFGSMAFERGDDLDPDYSCGSLLSSSAHNLYSQFFLPPYTVKIRMPGKDNQNELMSCHPTQLR